LLPLKKPLSQKGKYDIYPTFDIGDGKIFAGFDSLAERLAGQRFVIVDGYNGARFDIFRNNLENSLRKSGYSTSWKNVSDFYRPETEIKGITLPFLGGSDPLFGTRTSLILNDFFEKKVSEMYAPDREADIIFLAGPGASLIADSGFLVYVDVPKNEIQYRSRNGEMTNLGISGSGDPAEMYKYFYFVEWVVLNRHKMKILPYVDLYIDGQRAEMPVWMEGKVLRESVDLLSRNIFRVRPWFEPGPWGGTWIKDKIDSLDKNVPNYAWSFELITPENGLIFESSGYMMEVSFDCLMFLNGEEVLGDCYSRFGTEFPIRFDFLDTFDGGNLSLQCHPRPEYTKEHFGEGFTQEETYYILDTKDDAAVYLGFCDDIDPLEFRNELEDSHNRKIPFNYGKYILVHHVRKHDLLLIPYGTIHGSGRNNLVLEISSTPYIFTFKMYDWLRPDLNGKLRNLNISRGMENLFFERRGDYVKDKLLSKPVLIYEESGYKKYHLPTHETHLYDVERYHISQHAEISTGNKCLVMNLVEGEEIEITTSSGMMRSFSYAETFVIPAAAGSIRIINRSKSEAVIVSAFVK
jgi:mannose-6-phosphate isomerase class I